MFAVPKHLPAKLTTVYWGWDWLTFGTPGEPWDDVGRAMRECRERGYNTVRAEIGPDFMFTRDRRRRGPIAFRTSVEGGLRNCHCVNEKGGGVLDVFDRVMNMFEAAEKHDMFVVPTTWEYQDAINLLADDGLRAELLSVPLEDRLMSVSVLEGVLLDRLRERGLIHRIAYFENYNEINHDFRSLDAEKRRRITEESLDYLHQRFPELILSADYGHVEYDSFAANSDLVDVHPYTSHIMADVYRMVGVNCDPAFPNKNNPHLAALLRKDPEDWDQFRRRAHRARDFWHQVWYFYENLDNERYDELCLRLFQEKGEKIISQIAVPLAQAAGYAQAKGLGVVVDEGYIFYPPYFSRFEQTDPGHYVSQTAADLCTRLGYWGFFASGYTRPNTIAWHDEAHCDVVRAINRGFVEGRLSSQAG